MGSRRLCLLPSLFHTLGTEYKDFGGQDIEVMHHSQLINHLQQEGKLPEPKHDDNVTYHDPCYLGRIGGELEAPRAAIGGVGVETENHGRGSFCCGAGGAQMWMEEHVDEGYDRVNIIRSKELGAYWCEYRCCWLSHSVLLWSQMVFPQ